MHLHKDSRERACAPLALIATALLVACEPVTGVGGESSQEEAVSPATHVITSLAGEVPDATSGTVSLVLSHNDPVDGYQEEVVSSTAVSPSGEFSFDTLPDLSSTHQHMLDDVLVGILGGSTHERGSLQVSNPTVQAVWVHRLDMNYGDGANHQLLELGSVIIDENGARFGSRYTVGWVYADGDTDLVGRVQFLIFETALRKGWNQVVFEATSDGDLTLVTAAAAPEETQWIVW